MKTQKFVAYSGDINLTRLDDANYTDILREALAKTLDHLSWQIRSGQYDKSLPEKFTLEMCVVTDKWNVQIVVTLTPLIEKENQ